MHTLATRSHGIFCEKFLSKTTNTLLYISIRVSLIAFKFFLRVPRCLGTITAVITRLRQNAGKWSIFANQVTIDRWGVGPIETINSGHNGAVMNAQNHRWGLGPIQACNSGHNDAVVNAQNNRWGLGPMENSVSGANHAVFLCTNRQVRSGTQRDY